MTLNIILKIGLNFMFISAVLQESLSHIAPPQLNCWGRSRRLSALRLEEKQGNIFHVIVKPCRTHGFCISLA